MRKTKKVLSVMLAAMMTTSLVVGCAGGGGETGNGKSESGGDGEKVTLRFSWWGGDERNEATLDVIEAYEKEHPNVTIEAEYSGDDGYQEKLSTALAGNTAADIIQMGPGWMPSYVAQGDFFVDFNDYTDQIDLSGFSEELLKKGTYNEDELLGIPTGVATMSFVVNKTLADEIGLDFTDLTWESLLEMGKKVQEYNSDYYLLNVDTAYLLTNVFRTYSMQITGKSFINDAEKKINPTEEQITEVLQYIRDLYSTKTVQAAGETATFEGATQTNTKWVNGEVVCVMTNSSQINNFTSANENAEYMVVNMPVQTDASKQLNDGYGLEPPQLMCVNKNSEHVEEAVEFLDYFFNDEEAAATLKDLRSVPPTENAQKICEEQGLVDELVIQSVELMSDKNGVYEMGLTTDAEIEAVFKTMIESVIYEESTPEEAAANGVEQINSILENK